MLNRFLTFIKKHALHLEGNTWLLAVSGGVDSMVLLDLCNKAKMNVAVAHCNFQLRGEESEADTQFVKTTCLNLNIPFHQKYFDTKAYAKSKGISTQMAARALRYAWFNELSESESYHQVAVAHHAQDNLETVLLNLARGTSISGLRGMQPKSNNIVRPLLSFSKEDILAYAAQEKVQWREDSSNESDDYKRNYLRHQVIPAFTQLNDGFYTTFENSLEKNLEVEKVFNEKITALKSFIEKTDKGFRFSKSAIVHSGIGAYQLTTLLKPFNLNYEQGKELLNRLDGTPGKQFSTSTHQILVDREFVYIDEFENDSFEPLTIEAGQCQFSIHGNTYNLNTLEAGASIDRSVENAFLSFDKLGFPLEIRAWREGDSFVPLGMRGKKKLSDFMIDQKIPLNLKGQIRVLTSGDRIVWVIGHRIDDRFKVKPETTKILHISKAR